MANIVDVPQPEMMIRIGSLAEGYVAAQVRLTESAGFHGDAQPWSLSCLVAVSWLALRHDPTLIEKLRELPPEAYALVEANAKGFADAIHREAREVSARVN